MLPVSLQVLEAGEGGGGMSNRSAFSLFEEHLVVKLAEKHFEVINPDKRKINNAYLIHYST